MSKSRYGIEKRIIRPASLAAADLVTQTEAVGMLGVRQQVLLNRINDGKFTVVWHLRRKRARAGSARLLLRGEVEAAIGVGRAGGGMRRSAPEIVTGLPDVADTEYGIEARVITLAPEVEPDQVMGQARAAELLGVKLGTLARQVNKGRFTVVWDLERDGTGHGSARMLLRAEVEQALAGGRRMSRASYRLAPGVSSLSGFS